MKFLITGIAGFIGSHLARSLLSKGHTIVGIDDFNDDIYNSSIKYNRLMDLLNLTNDDINTLRISDSIHEENISIYKLNIANQSRVEDIFSLYKGFDVVINLAAYANPLLSLKNPNKYIESNIVGFFNILNSIKLFSQDSLFIYASTSSVYGLKDNQYIPSRLDDNTNKPISLYAATKKCDELLTFSYYKSFNVKSVGLRFFTVYGPFGRPDMALWKFTKSILNDSPIELYNYGNNFRDFTYIDDLIKSINCIIDGKSSLKSDYLVYNIGSQHPIKISDFVSLLEESLNKKAIKLYVPPKVGDTVYTFSDSTDLYNDFHYRPDTDIRNGIQSFVDWYIRRKY